MQRLMDVLRPVYVEALLPDILAILTEQMAATTSKKQTIENDLRGASDPF